MPNVDVSESQQQQKGKQLLILQMNSLMKTQKASTAHVPEGNGNWVEWGTICFQADKREATEEAL